MTLIGFKGQNHPQQTDKRGALDEVDDRGTDPAFFMEVEARFDAARRVPPWPHEVREARQHCDRPERAAPVRLLPADLEPRVTPSGPSGGRRVRWFSAGAASAVATKLDLAEHPGGVVAYCDPGSEHSDNARFLTDCEAWFGVPILRLRSEKYADTWQVFSERRFLVSQSGALCSTELKKKLRQAFQEPGDVQVFGFTSEEKDRADRFRANNVEVDLLTPLIDHDLTKQDCLAMVDRAGIVLPAMYRLGYHNANCIGCVHGGMGYWNKIRVDFPDVFDRMAGMERDIGHALNKDDDGPVWLDELDPDRGDYPTEITPDCSILCAIAEPLLQIRGVA